MKELGYLGIDQYGHNYHMERHPRKELLKQLGKEHADNMYVDTKGGKVRHVGYIIGGMWISVYRVGEWKEAV